jgi:protocatechuate 3,4-dioxygenase alpha subunit
MRPRTPSQTVGPFFSIGLSVEPQNEVVEPGSPGAVEIVGRVVDGAGEGVPDSMVEIWQADESGEHREQFGWARSGTDAEGAFRFVTVKPGPVADGEGRTQAPHLDVFVFARGLLKPVYTRMYFPDEPTNRDDPLLAALDETGRAALTATPESGGLRFDVRLQGDDQTPFFAW